MLSMRQQLPRLASLGGRVGLAGHAPVRWRRPALAQGMPSWAASTQTAVRSFSASVLATSGRATFTGSVGELVAREATRQGSADAQYAQRLRVRVTNRAEASAGKAKPPNPYAIFMAVPIFIMGVAFIGVDLITIATTVEKTDVHEVLGQDWNDEKVQEAIYCFVEESVIPKLVGKVEAALIRCGQLPEPEKGEAGDKTRAANRKAAQTYLQKEAKMNPVLSWKAQRGVVAGPGPVRAPVSFEHPLPVSVVFCEEVVNATAPICVRVNSSNTKPLQLTAHFVRDETYFRLEAVSVVDQEEGNVSACVYNHDRVATLKSIPSESRFAIKFGPEAAIPEQPLQRHHSNYTPVTWWDCPISEDRSVLLENKKGVSYRLVGSQQPKFPRMSAIFGADSISLQSQLPAIDYMARKARINELLGSSLSEADTLTRLQVEECSRGIAEMYMAICKTSQDAFRRSNRIEPGFLECLAEGTREFCTTNLVDEGLAHLDTFHSFIKTSRDEGALVMFDLCKASLLLTASHHEEAAATIEAAAEKIRLLLGTKTPEYGNAMHMAAEAYFAMHDHKNALRCSGLALATLATESFVDISAAYVARILVNSAKQLYPETCREVIHKNRIIDSATKRSPAYFGDFLVLWAIHQAGISIDAPKVECNVTPEEESIVEGLSRLAAWNRIIRDGLPSRQAAKELDWTAAEGSCQSAMEDIFMESSMLNRAGRPYVRTVCRLNDDAEDVHVDIEGVITLNSEVKPGMTLQVTVNDQEPIFATVNEQMLCKGFSFSMPLLDLSHPAHVLMELAEGTRSSPITKSMHAVGVSIPVVFFSSEYGMDNLEEHMQCRELFLKHIEK